MKSVKVSSLLQANFELDWMWRDVYVRQTSQIKSSLRLDIFAAVDFSRAAICKLSSPVDRA